MTILEAYQKEIGGDPIPLMQVQGNEVLVNKFGDDPNEVYLYCIEHKVKWEEVLGFDEEKWNDPLILS